MDFFSKRRLQRVAGAGGSVEVSESNGVRCLHLGNRTVQSAMRIKQPDRLELDYTRCMMAFLLFHPDPRQVLLVGLGGGSLAKFIYRAFPESASVTVEIDPRVVAAARAYFFVPADDARLRVEIGDGAAYVVDHPCSCDVLMVDGFDANAQVDGLCTQAFYDGCAAALTANGVFVVNLWGNDSNFETYLKRIGVSFDGLVLCLPTSGRSNITVLAFKQSPGAPLWRDLRERARHLETHYDLTFVKFLGALRDANLHTEKRLLI